MEENKKSGAAVQAAPERAVQAEAPVKKPEQKDEHKYGFSFLYWLLVRVYYVLVKILYFIRIEGKENIPKDRNVILMGNHQFDFDPVTLAICDMSRQYHFMGKKELWSNKVIGWLWTQVHGFPVDRGNVDMAAMRTAQNILKRGECLGIFPEGTRHKGPEMLPLLSGVAMIALRSKCDVVPIYIDGNYKPFRKIVVRVGKPVKMDDLLAGRITKDSFDVLMGRVEEAFYELSGGKSRPAAIEGK
ncbi:MAG: 1-acyl-sn-glycerol-3-phosphate acyltransferase [Clostridia bacterium]|nr:1-acyl-sn-glycerol-3-phosphate acyltransferase [Clostridia bacterium]